VQNETRSKRGKDSKALRLHYMPEVQLYCTKIILAYGANFKQAKFYVIFGTAERWNALAIIPIEELLLVGFRLFFNKNFSELTRQMNNNILT
jgi:hypothetical protein